MPIISENELKKKLGKLIAARRKAIGLSQEKLAERMGIQTRTLSKIENGHTFITAETLCKFCDIFNLPPKSFFEYEDESSIDGVKLKEIIDRIKLGGKDKIDFYYKLINLIDNNKI